MKLQEGASVADIQSLLKLGYSNKMLRHMASAYGKVKLQALKTCLGAGVLGTIAQKKGDMECAMDAAKSVAGWLGRMDAEAAESREARSHHKHQESVAVLARGPILSWASSARSLAVQSSRSAARLAPRPSP